MRALTRQEEQILLVIHHLDDKAYLVNIREKLKEITGKYLDVGTINKPLKRLHLQEYLDVQYGDPTPVRGGKSIKYYHLTDKAYKALAEVKTMHDKMWQNVILQPKNI